MGFKKLAIFGFTAAASLSAISQSHAVVTNFDAGLDGWKVVGFNDPDYGGDYLLSSGGNTGANMQFVEADTFGANFHNDSNPNFIGNYSRFGNNFSLGVDLKVNSIDYGGGFTTDLSTEVARHLVVELVSYSHAEGDFPYSSVWYDLGTISSATQADWTHFSVNIANPASTALPAGWGGYGAEDSLGNPLLPADLTFADILGSVDEMRFTTYVPGYFYGFTYFNMQYDNAGITVAPEPASVGLLSVAALGMLSRRRKN